jgi:hypothetical protein
MRLRLGVFAATIGASCALAGCGAHRDDHTVSGAGAGLSRVELDVQSGASSITVESVSLGGGLYRVSTPLRSGLRPSVQRDHDRLRVSLRGHGGSSALKIEVSNGVVWELRFSGGASDLSVDFRTGKLSGIDLLAGDGRATLALPRPSGTIPIVENGGVSRLAVRVVGDAPVRLRISGGAARVELDGVTHTGVAGGSLFSSPAWSSTHDRYDVLARGGVSSLEIRRV